MARSTPYTEERPYTPFPVDKIPTKRVHVLSILHQLGDDCDAMTPAQRAAFRSLYRLDDPRTVRELIEAGEL